MFVLRRVGPVIPLFICQECFSSAFILIANLYWDRSFVFFQLFDNRDNNFDGTGGILLQ